MTGNFYVPYNQVKFFTLKNNGVYRHNLSFRIYLYLCHFHSGRIEYSDIKKLVKRFDSSHTAVKKAISYLSEIGFVKLYKNWISAVGHDSTNKLIKDKIGRNFNIEFLFKEELLFNRVKFTNHLFFCIFQSSAMIRGKKVDKLIPLENLHSESVMLKRRGQRFICPVSVNNPGFIQQQSSSYQGKMTGRHNITTFKRMKQCVKDHNIFNEDSRMRYFNMGKSIVCSGNGESITFGSHSAAKDFLDSLKSNRLISQSSWIQLDHCINKSFDRQYVIIEPNPHSYFFHLETKKSFKNFNYNFSKEMSF